VRAEPSDALAVEGRLLTLLHITHRGWEVYLASVGEAEAGMALVGPALGAALPDGPPVGTVGGLPAELGRHGRVWRWEAESGEIAELRVPAGEAGPVWRRLVERVSACGGRPVGRLALAGAHADTHADADGDGDQAHRNERSG
jgi:hypothetical protein